MYTGLTVLHKHFLPVSTIGNSILKRTPLVAVLGLVIHGRMVLCVRLGQEVEDVVIRRVVWPSLVLLAVVIVVRILKTRRKIWGKFLQHSRSSF